MNLHPIVTTDWLDEHMEEEHVHIIDATVFMEEGEEGIKVKPGEEAYKEAHIPGAVFANLLTQFSDIDAPYPLMALPHEAFVHEARGLGIDDTSTVVIYDRGPVVGASYTSSDWASRLWWQFRLSGMDNVYVLGGGFPKWEQEARPVTEEIPLVAAGNFQGNYRPELYADINDIKQSMYDKNTIIMNCLSSADFHGETNNYPRKGHIPGSANVFFGELSTDTGALPHEEKLHQIFSSTGALDPEKKVITYCGGGIAATWNALALAALGKEAAVYDGSLNEWMSDEKNPLSTGTST